MRVDTETQIQPNYCVCVLNSEGQLLLTPLTSFHQVRPSFDHVDQEREARIIGPALHQTGSALTNQKYQIRPREWKEVKFHVEGSEQQDVEFLKLSESGVTTNVLTGAGLPEDTEMYDDGQLWKVAAKNEYQDLLAPFDISEDYSTASMLKNKGPNLTMEKLAGMTIEQSVIEIIKKAGVIDYERLVRLMKSACSIAKH